MSAQPLLIPASSRVILVGNGPSLMTQRLGHKIDAFDEVVRFNQFRCQEFERHSGTKTTIYCTFGRGMLPGDLNQRPSKVILTHEKAKCAYPAAWTYPVPAKFYNALRAEIKAASAKPNAADLLPSSGFLVARWLLDTGQAECITLTGFDHFTKNNDKRHHYWIPGNFGRPKEHDGDVEAELLTMYCQQGRIEYLTP
ncbi:MAG: glycosyltransferase family 29 protein [Verrucomicrobiota bacterium]